MTTAAAASAAAAAAAVRRRVGSVLLQSPGPASLAVNAWHQLEQLVASNERPAPVVTRKILHGLQFHRDPVTSLEAARVMEALGTPLSSEQVHGLVSFLLHRGRPREALYALQELSLDVSVQTKAKVLVHLVQRNFLCEAKELYATLRDTAHLEVHTVMAHHLARHGQVQEAKKVLRTMHSTGVVPDAAAWRTILFVLTRDDDHAMALDLLDELERGGWQLGPAAYATLVAAYAPPPCPRRRGRREAPSRDAAVARLAGEIDRRGVPWGAELHNAFNRLRRRAASRRVRARCTTTGRLDPLAADRTISVVLERSSAQEALRLFEDVRRASNRHFAQLTYGKLIRGLVREGHDADALRLCEELIASSDLAYASPLTNKTLVVLLRVLDRAGRDPQVEELFRRARVAERPSAHVYAAMIQFLLRRGRRAEAEALHGVAVREAARHGDDAHDPVLWHVFVHHAEDDAAAWRWIARMVDAGVAVRGATCLRLVRRAVRGGRDDDLQRILALRSDDGTVETSTAAVLAQQGRTAEAVALIVRAGAAAPRAPDGGLPPESFTAASYVLRRAVDAAQPELVATVLDHLRRHGRRPVAGALRQVCRLGTAPDVCRSLEAMAAADPRVVAATPDGLFLEAMAATTDCRETAERSWARTRQLGFRPSRHFYATMVRHSARAAAVARADELARECVADGHAVPASVAVDLLRARERRRRGDGGGDDDGLLHAVQQLERDDVVPIDRAMREELIVRFHAEQTARKAPHVRTPEDQELCHARQCGFRGYTPDRFADLAERLRAQHATGT